MQINPWEQKQVDRWPETKMPKILNLPYGAEELWEHDWWILEQDNPNKSITNQIKPSPTVKITLNPKLQTKIIQTKPTAKITTTMVTREQTIKNNSLK